jgi:hypothetical protein
MVFPVWYWYFCSLNCQVWVTWHPLGGKHWDVTFNLTFITVRYHSDGFHPNAVHFADLKETDILWHYLKTKSVHHMHKIFTYDQLMNQYHNVSDQLKRLQKEQSECWWSHIVYYHNTFRAVIFNFYNNYFMYILLLTLSKKCLYFAASSKRNIIEILKYWKCCLLKKQDR